MYPYLDNVNKNARMIVVSTYASKYEREYYKTDALQLTDRFFYLQRDSQKTGAIFRYERQTYKRR